MLQYKVMISSRKKQNAVSVESEIANDLSGPTAQYILELMKGNVPAGLHSYNVNN